MKTGCVTWARSIKFWWLDPAAWCPVWSVSLRIRSPRCHIIQVNVRCERWPPMRIVCLCPLQTQHLLRRRIYRCRRRLKGIIECHRPMCNCLLSYSNQLGSPVPMHLWPTHCAPCWRWTWPPPLSSPPSNRAMRQHWPCCRCATGATVAASLTPPRLHFPCPRRQSSCRRWLASAAATSALRPNIVSSAHRPICYCDSMRSGYCCCPNCARYSWEWTDRWPAWAGLDAGHTMPDGSRGTWDAMVARNRAVASAPETIMAGRGPCWRRAPAAVADRVTMALVSGATSIDGDRRFRPSCPSCGCRASWPMVRPMNVSAFADSPRSQATSAPLWCMVAAGSPAPMRMMDDWVCSLWMVAAVFCGCQLQRRPPLVAVALAAGNGFWTSWIGGRSASHSLTCPPEGICAIGTLCMLCDSFYWSCIHRYSCIRISRISCCTIVRRMTGMEKNIRKLNGIRNNARTIEDETNLISCLFTYFSLPKSEWKE